MTNDKDKDKYKNTKIKKKSKTKKNDPNCRSSNSKNPAHGGAGP